MANGNNLNLPSKQLKCMLNGTHRELDEWSVVEGSIPPITSHGVLVKMHAAAINYREILIPAGGFPYQLDLPVIGGSDGAGEVIAVGPGVRKWQVGDRVTTLFNPGHQSGALWGDAYRLGSLGATIDGTPQEYAVFEEDWLVRLASNLSYLEGASLSNASVAAWNALYGLKALKPGEWVLVQGTGGVSMFATQFAKAGGANVVATTSGPKKAELLRWAGADHVINYHETPNWGEVAKKLTGRNEGFDNIIEVGGAGTLQESAKAVKMEGTITLIGVVTGLESPLNPLEALYRIFTLRRIHVGSRVQFEEMMKAIEANKIQPVIDPRVFALGEIKEALQYLKDQKHVGKVAIRIAPE